MIIGNLDDDGYLRMSLAEMVGGTDFSEKEAESVLKDIQSFDPTGVAARDLVECLLLQIGHLGKSPMGSLGARPGALKGSNRRSYRPASSERLGEETVCEDREKRWMSR